MHKILLAFLFCLTCSLSAQTPTKLFDVRNANGVVDGANTYAHATVIVFRDTAAKSNMIDAFCDAYGYQEGSGTKQAFFNAQLKEFLKGTYKNQKVMAARRTAESSAGTLADEDLP